MLTWEVGVAQEKLCGTEQLARQQEALGSLTVHRSQGMIMEKGTDRGVNLLPAWCSGHGGALRVVDGRGEEGEGYEAGIGKRIRGEEAR